MSKKTPFWSRIGGQLSDMATSVSAFVSDTYDDVSGAAARLSGGIPTIDVNVFVIHGSSDPDDYTLHFAFDPLLERLNSETLAKPNIVLWSGRSDMNREVLSRRLTAQFMTKFNLAREQAGEAAESDALSKERKANSSTAAGAIGLVISGAITLLLTRVHPVVSLIMLALALLGGKDVTMILSNYITSLFTGDGADDRIESALKQIERQLKKKDEDLLKKAKELPIHVHPHLYGVASHLCRISKSPLPTERVADAGPEITADMVETFDASIRPFYTT